MAEKIFAKGLWAKRQTFKNGGHIVKMSVNVAMFIEWLQAQEVSEKGYVDLEMQGAKVERLDDKGNVILNVSLNTWKPDQQGGQQGTQSAHGGQSSYRDAKPAQGGHGEFGAPSSHGQAKANGYQPQQNSFDIDIDDIPF